MQLIIALILITLPSLPPPHQSYKSVAELLTCYILFKLNPLPTACPNPILQTQLHHPMGGPECWRDPDQQVYPLLRWVSVSGGPHAHAHGLLQCGGNTVD